MLKQIQKNEPANLAKIAKENLKNVSKSDIKKCMTPKNDVVFRLLFGQAGSEDITKDFLEGVLDTRIKAISLGKETMLLPEKLNEKIGIIDVHITLEDGTIIDLEMQSYPDYVFEKRLYFYVGRLYSKQILRGRRISRFKKDNCYNTYRL